MTSPVIIRADRRAARDPGAARVTVHQRFAEPEAAGTPSVVRHRELAGEGWRQTAERLAEYLERRSTSWPG